MENEQQFFIYIHFQVKRKIKFQKYNVKLETVFHIYIEFIFHIER